MEWISVKDRLPDVEGNYLVYADNLIALGEFKFSHHGDWYVQPFLSDWYRSKSFVTHWMPLPEPPKRESLLFSFETVEDGYVIYRGGTKLTPWYLVDMLNSNIFDFLKFYLGFDDDS